MNQPNWIHRDRKLWMMLGLVLILNFQFSIFNPIRAQMPGGKKVEVTKKTEVVGGRRYFVHIVDEGQTVYAIARAYGLKETEAVTKKDIHFLHVGDTVWLPCKGQRLSDGTLAPEAGRGAVIGQAHHEKPETNGQSNNGAIGQSAMGTSTPAIIRPRVSEGSIVVSVMMPLYLSQMDKISTSKFDVEQRGKTSYKSFEFIQFYEGMMLALERLEARGYNVTLNVVDVEENTAEAVERAFRSHDVGRSDLLIALLTRQPFERAAQLAREAQLFVVNPVSDRREIVEGNPYVFKCMPSMGAYARGVVEAIGRELPGMPVYVVHSGAKAEAAAQAAIVAELGRHPEMAYTLINWSTPSKLLAALKGNSRAAVVSIYQGDRSKTRIYVSQLLNKLSAFKGKGPTLFSFADWTTEQGDVDLAQLQGLNYHTFYADWDRGDGQQRQFIERFREKYKTEPVGVYAGMANDIVLYFVTGLQQKGTAFFKNPVLKRPEGMLYPLRFEQSSPGDGFENQEAKLYKMTEYRFGD